MKKLIILSFIFCFFSLSYAQTCRIVADNWHSLTLEFSIGELQQNTFSADDGEFTTLSLTDLIPSAAVGAPCLPVFSRLIEVPQCQGFDIAVTTAEYDTIFLQGPRLFPAQPSRSKSDTSRHQLLIDNKIYSTDAFFGFPTASVEKVGVARDRHLARLQFSPVRYNPVTGMLIVCRHATVEVRYAGSDRQASMELFNRYFSPHFASGAASLNSLYPKSVANAAPLRYVIIAHSSFRGQMDTFVQWKRRKGFITDIYYTDSAAVGSTTASISAFLQGLYTNATSANPAPTYVLFVGDHEQIPAFTGTTSSEHITDLYYISWTSGDNIPDCYSGRFSAQNVGQLTPQIQKTLMYEQYTFADPSFLDRAVLVAGVDGGNDGDFGYTHADPAMDYAATHYINSTQGFTQVRYFKNNTSIVPNAPGVTIGSSQNNSATVQGFYNQGAGWVNYSAHGSETCWGTPYFGTSEVGAMTNTQKFGLFIGNCCLTNKFQVATCFGESLLRKGNYAGAVGYIGGSNSTYWGEDFYWAVGLRSGIGATMSMAYNASNLGAYDRLCHTHNEPYSQWAMSQGSIMMVGNMAVESSTSSRKLYYWEIYHLMGDPSVMTYLTQAQPMNVAVSPVIMSGDLSLAVAAAPYAYVALTDTLTRQLVAAAFADAAGNATLMLPVSLPVGGYELAAWAQQYQPSFSPVTVAIPDGAFPMVLNIEAQSQLVSGQANLMTVTLSNLGNETAHNVQLQIISSDDETVALDSQTFAFDSLVPGDTVLIPIAVSVGQAVADGTAIRINSALTCSERPEAFAGLHTFVVAAPKVDIAVVNGPLSVEPGGMVDVVVEATNTGHAPLTDGQLVLSSPTSLLSSDEALSYPLALLPDETTTLTFHLSADTMLPENIWMPLQLTAGSISQSVNLFVGTNPQESFEAGIFHTSGWSQGTYPWAFSNSDALHGSYCLRSSSSLTHGQTSQINLAVNIQQADSITFYYMVSSESGYDKFLFAIDGTEMVEASGEEYWTRAAFLVPAGSHTLSFSYAKDGSVNRYEDCAWIDDVMLPHTSNPVVFQAVDICQYDTVVTATDTINTSEEGVVSRVVPLASGGAVLTDYFVRPVYVTNIDTVVCDALLWFDSLYTVSSSAHHHLTSVFGCDSLIDIELVVKYSSFDTIRDTVFAASYEWNDSVYTHSGNFDHVFAAANGCDSVVTLVLNLINIPHNDIPDADASAELLTLFPNPTAGMVTFSREVGEAILYDASGRLLRHLRNVRQIDLSGLPSGRYLLNIGTATIPIIKQ